MKSRYVYYEKIPIFHIRNIIDHNLTQELSIGDRPVLIYCNCYGGSQEHGFRLNLKNLF